MNKLFALSKWVHKYIGLLLILFLMWMSVSGILMNHPEWISRLTVPATLIPDPYDVHDWNQGTLRDAVFHENGRDVYFAGIRGIWKSSDGGQSFEAFDRGLSPSLFYQKTNDLYYDKNTSTILSGTDGGLFFSSDNDSEWTPVQLSNNKIDKVKKILKTRDHFLIITDSEAFISSDAMGPYKPHDLPRPETGVELIKLFFDLHDGKVWGLPGKLFFDLVGLILFFLSVSAFFLWFFPKVRKKQKLLWKEKLRVMYRFCFKYHLKWGIWFAAPLLIIGGTGLFMRPPLLIILADQVVSRSLYPGPLSPNPWHKKIKNAVYLESTDQVIIEADGLWLGSTRNEAPFSKLNWDSPIFVMGTNVLEETAPGQFLMGSFSGLLDFEPETGVITDHLTNQPAPDRSKVRITGFRVTGYFQTPSGQEYISSHHAGLMEIGATETSAQAFPTPKALKENGKMPLWDFLFELHNGRIFSKWIGNWSKLLVPLGAFLFVLLSLTGIFDWFMLSVINPRKFK